MILTLIYEISSHSLYLAASQQIQTLVHNSVQTHLPHCSLCCQVSMVAIATNVLEFIVANIFFCAGGCILNQRLERQPMADAGVYFCILVAPPITGLFR